MTPVLLVIRQVDEERLRPDWILLQACEDRFVGVPWDPDAEGLYDDDLANRGASGSIFDLGDALPPDELFARDDAVRHAITWRESLELVRSVSFDGVIPPESLRVRRLEDEAEYDLDEAVRRFTVRRSRTAR